MMDFSVPLQGMQQASDRVDVAAQRIASMSPAVSPQQNSTQPAADNVDLSAEMVALMDGRNHFAANVKVVHAVDEMTKATLDLLA